MDVVPTIISGIALSISLVSLYRSKRNDDASRLHAAEQKRTAIRANTIQKQVAVSSILQTIDRLTYNIEVSKHPNSAAMIAALNNQGELVRGFIGRNQTMVEKIDALQLRTSTDSPTLTELEAFVGQTEAGLKEALRHAADIQAQEQLLLQKIARWTTHNEA